MGVSAEIRASSTGDVRAREREREILEYSGAGPTCESRCDP